MHRHAPYGDRPANVNHLCDPSSVRWVRRVLVTLLLLAPIGLVAAVAWPDEGEDGDGVRDEGSGPGGALVAGDTIQDQLGFGEVAVYRLVGDDEVVIDVTGLPDGTLTVRDDDNRELAFNDDTNGLDPQVTVDPDGRELRVEVRDLGGQAGLFTLAVD